jgi:hypothetical protein
MIEFSQLRKYMLRAEDGDLGTVHDVLIDDESWNVRYLVAQTGVWLLSRHILISPMAIYGPDQARQEMLLKLSKEQIKNGPELAVDPPISREREAIYRDYYKWPKYWDDPNALDRVMRVNAAPEASTLGSVQPIVTLVPEMSAVPNDPMLRSALQLQGFVVVCEGEEVGKISDLLLRWPEWEIGYLSVDLTKEDRTVLIPVASATTVNWDGRTLRPVVSLSSLRTAPSYDESSSNDRVFLDGVADHYQRHVGDK